MTDRGDRGAWWARTTILGLALAAVVAGAYLIDRYPGGRLTAGVALIVLGAVLAGAGIALTAHHLTREDRDHDPRP